MQKRKIHYQSFKPKRQNWTMIAATAAVATLGVETYGSINAHADDSVSVASSASNTTNVSTSSASAVNYGYSTYNVAGSVDTTVNYNEDGQLVEQSTYTTSPYANVNYQSGVPGGYHLTDNNQTVNAGSVSRSVPVSIAKNQITTTVQFVSGSDVLGSKTYTNLAGAQINVNNDLPAGYQLAQSGLVNAFTNNSTISVQVVKTSAASSATSSADSTASSAASSAASSDSSSIDSSAVSSASDTSSASSSTDSSADSSASDSSDSSAASDNDTHHSSKAHAKHSDDIDPGFDATKHHQSGQTTNDQAKHHQSEQRANTTRQQYRKNKQKLPQTGEDNQARNASIAGALMLGLSSALFFGSKRKRRH
ncbi:LPXTG cell wall anchor domain-containing protein [Nicoliella lavandulae]|uniref:LPXTG cell wall anchor domain-containing protein n=1 Tax=Nicoliella lavandulae TaxID=3082954 RepID=A0ABU8SIT8_9LACO